MKLELKWVSIIFVIHILWHIGERFFGFYDENAAYQEMSATSFMVVYAFLMLLAMLDLRKSNKGYLNRRHGFTSSLFISLVLVALAPIMVLLLWFVIQPDFFNKMILLSLENDEYQAYEAAVREYNYWNYLTLYIAGYLLVGSLSGAFWSFILHKMPEPVTD